MTATLDQSRAVLRDLLLTLGGPTALDEARRWAATRPADPVLEALLDEARAPLVAFTVPGPPQGARRHRVDTRSGRPRTYHADAHTAAEALVAQCAALAWRGRPPLDEPVRLHVVAVCARPQRLLARRYHGDERRLHTGKPDADNVAKLVMDGITKARVWADDTRVAVLHVERWYGAVSPTGGLEAPRVEVRLERLVAGEVAP